MTSCSGASQLVSTAASLAAGSCTPASPAPHPRRAGSHGVASAHPAALRRGGPLRLLAVYVPSEQQQVVKKCQVCRPMASIVQKRVRQCTKLALDMGTGLHALGAGHAGMSQSKEQPAQQAGALCSGQCCAANVNNREVRREGVVNLRTANAVRVAAGDRCLHKTTWIISKLVPAQHAAGTQQPALVPGPHARRKRMQASNQLLHTHLQRIACWL